MTEREIDAKTEGGTRALKLSGSRVQRHVRVVVEDRRLKQSAEKIGSEALAVRGASHGSLTNRYANLGVDATSDGVFSTRRHNKVPVPVPA